LLGNLDWRGFLARPALASPPPQALELLRREPILITGAGGSIGAALALRLGALGPPKLILLETSESQLYTLERDWAASGAACTMIPILGNAGDEALLEEIFFHHSPRIVYHAAAFKHVPLMEEHPLAAIENNILGSGVLVRVATAHGARVVLLSTDKAVQPASVMGASKRVSEQIVLAAGGTVLRLGNVLHSSNNVAEVFARQIKQGGPLTVTSPESRRYFVTIDEAVNLLLTAALASPRALLAPILPSQHRIQELAQFMAQALAPERAIAIHFTGLRPGDKEAEELWSAEERFHSSSLDGLLVVEGTLPSASQLAGRLASLRAAHDARNLSEALTHLCALVPEYTPGPSVLALSAKSSPQVSA
jgi:FlaA1/EpsC-like NDP-sugar epimerase